MTKPNKEENLGERAQNSILISLLSCWRENHSGLRFGQWLFCLLAEEYGGDNSAIGDRLFQIEDEELIKLIEKR